MCPRPTAFSTHVAQMKPNSGAVEKTVPLITGVLGRMSQAGQVAEWSKAADCKSADPCGLRRFEPSPVHQFGDRNSRLEIRNSDDLKNLGRDSNFQS